MALGFFYYFCVLKTIKTANEVYTVRGGRFNYR